MARRSSKPTDKTTRTPHTPGPYRRVAYYVASPDEKVVADCRPDDTKGIPWKWTGVVRPEDEDTCVANADLFAAAPEMLAALKAVRWALEDGTLVDNDRDPEGNDIFNIVDKMIFKAEGGT